MSEINVETIQLGGTVCIIFIPNINKTKRTKKEDGGNSEKKKMFAKSIWRTHIPLVDRIWRYSIIK